MFKLRIIQWSDLLKRVANIAIDLRFRCFGPFSLEEFDETFLDFEWIFIGFTFLVVARFNFVKNSFVINVGSFNNGIYFPSSKSKNKFVYY